MEDTISQCLCITPVVKLWKQAVIQQQSVCITETLHNTVSLHNSYYVSSNEIVNLFKYGYLNAQKVAEIAANSKPFSVSRSSICILNSVQLPTPLYAQLMVFVTRQLPPPPPLIPQLQIRIGKKSGGFVKLIMMSLKLDKWPDK